MELYVIYGLPGVGKLTVAEELAQLTGYKVVHLHMLVDMLEPVFGFDGRGFVKLRNTIWPMVIEQDVADRLPGLITAFVFERTVPENLVANVHDYVIAGGGGVRFVELTCDNAKLDRRLASPERSCFRKITSGGDFDRILTSGHFRTPSGLGETVTLDTTHLSPAQAASKIQKRWK